MKLDDEKKPFVMILVGFLLVTAGMVLPFLMFLQIIPSTFFMNFFSYAASVSGLFLGLIGGASYVKIHRKK